MTLPRLRVEDAAAVARSPHAVGVPAAPLLACRGLAVEIGGKCVCDGLSWSVAAGEIWFVLGENGVGKSTLLSTLAGIRAARSGEVRLAGLPLAQWHERARAQQRALLCQHDDDPFPATVLERVLVGRHPYLPRFGWESAEDEAIARAALAAVGLAGLESRAVGTLSGGERRRVSLAAVLAQQATVMLLDEPTSQLDLRHQVAVLALLREQALGGRRAVVLVSHDPNLALRFGTHALLLFGGGQVAAGAVDQVLDAEALSRLYRHPLHAIVADGQRYFLPACDVPPSRDLLAAGGSPFDFAGARSPEQLPETGRTADADADDPGDDLGRRQEHAGDRAVQIAASARASRGAVQAAEHGIEQRGDDRWR